MNFVFRIFYFLVTVGLLNRDSDATIVPRNRFLKLIFLINFNISISTMVAGMSVYWAWERKKINFYLLIFFRFPMPSFPYGVDMPKMNCPSNRRSNSNRHREAIWLLRQILFQFKWNLIEKEFSSETKWPLAIAGINLISTCHSEEIKWACRLGCIW